MKKEKHEKYGRIVCMGVLAPACRHAEASTPRRYRHSRFLLPPRCRARLKQPERIRRPASLNRRTFYQSGKGGAAQLF